MITMFDPFIDYGCPGCEKSLRWTLFLHKAEIEHESPVTPYHCPFCNSMIVETRHPAIANNFLWARFYLPGVFLCTLGIFIPALGWILPLAVFTLITGFMAIIVYMIKERIGWKVYIPFEQDQ